MLVSDIMSLTPVGLSLTHLEKTVRQAPVARLDLSRSRLGENDPSRNQWIPKGFIGMNLATAQGTLGDVVA